MHAPHDSTHACLHTMQSTALPAAHVFPVKQVQQWQHQCLPTPQKTQSLQVGAITMCPANNGIAGSSIRHQTQQFADAHPPCLAALSPVHTHVQCYKGTADAALTCWSEHNLTTCLLGSNRPNATPYQPALHTPNPIIRQATMLPSQMHGTCITPVTVGG
jgi:hypothetical protein